MAGLDICQVNHPLVKSSLEGAQRKFARPFRLKEPLSVDSVQAIANFYVSDNSLATLRFLFILLAGFYWFFFVFIKLTAFALRMSSLILTTCLFMLLNGKLTSIGRVTPPILPGLGNLRAQLPLLKRFLRFCCSLVHRVLLFVVLLRSNLENTSTLAEALPLERNSRSTLSLLLLTFLSTAHIV